MARLVYSGRLSGARGPCRFVLNGAIVFDYTGEHSIAISIPLNQWVVAGRNDAETSNCDIRLEVNDLDEPGKPAVTVAAAGEGILVFASVVAFPRWAWIDALAAALPNEEERALREIREEMRKVFQMLLNRDSEGLARYSQERTDEMAAAYYKDAGARHSENRLSFEEFMNEPGLRLASVNWSETTLRVHPGRKLVDLEGDDSKPAIRYRSSDEASSVYVPFVYRRSQAGNWVVSR
jgi:hypothetical protein